MRMKVYKGLYNGCNMKLTHRFSLRTVAEAAALGGGGADAL